VHSFGTLILYTIENPWAYTTVPHYWRVVLGYRGLNYVPWAFTGAVFFWTIIGMELKATLNPDEEKMRRWKIMCVASFVSVATSALIAFTLRATLNQNMYSKIGWIGHWANLVCIYYSVHSLAKLQKTAGGLLRTNLQLRLCKDVRGDSTRVTGDTQNVPDVEKLGLRDEAEVAQLIKETSVKKVASLFTLTAREAVLFQSYRSLRKKKRIWGTIGVVFTLFMIAKLVEPWDPNEPAIETKASFEGPDSTRLVGLSFHVFGVWYFWRPLQWSK